jgi:hypothetical protein
MNKRLITIGLVSGTTIVTGLGIALPDLSTGIASMAMGGASLSMALQVYKDSPKKKDKQNGIRRAKVILLPQDFDNNFFKI